MKKINKIRFKIMRLLLYSIIFYFTTLSVTAQNKPISDDAFICYNFALAMDKKGNYERAVTNFLKAYELDSSYSDVFKLIGLTYLKAYKFKDAIPYFEKAIEIKPDTVESYMNLGNAYYSLKDYKNAIKYYEKAIEINSEHRSAYRNIGNAYYSIHNNEKYLENFKKAARLGDIEIQNWLRTNGHSW